ncbi:MAG: inverse autotransporter beta domain-containing protein [Desulfovibrio sp.]|jgi:hypothetical protein|nr:inverse autotransporter beta domain-containing protein [Desulfovibrio sp.]
MLRKHALLKFRGVVVRCTAYAVILTLCLPPAAAFAPAPARAGASHAAYVLQRMNSAERQAEVEEMARKDAVLRASGEYTAASVKALEESRNAALPPSPSGRVGPEAPLPSLSRGGQDSAGSGRDAGATGRASKNTKASLPNRVVNAMLPDGIASAVLPDVRSGNARDKAPRPLSYILMEQGASFLGVPAPMLPGADEGLGFHQDGTVRKAGGSGHAGPSDGGMRAAAYARSGLGYGGYLDGYVPLSGIGYDHLTGRYDLARDGRRSYERRFDGFDPVRTAQDRVLSWGIGALNSAGEAAMSSLVDNGRVRLNFTIDWDGNFRGEGDVLLPFYDSQYTTIFTQIGARSMAVSGGESDGEDRWIGNFGLGQRWFPAAKDEEDAGDWMVGYNAFFDNDFTRSHQRGGVGFELQYDWLHLASNYYFPLSDWKGSYDFDSRFIEERPAEGWDARVKAYVPFYRNVALTGAYTQWYGDHVGMFGHSKLEKDPRVWSYGVEYTPVPLVSAFLTQRSTERGRSETEYGLNFTYHFGMPWDEQVKHSKVAELRTVSGSRHEFVDRENRIILEYRAKNSYRIEYMGSVGPNLFRFRVLNGFDEFMAGQTVYVTASEPYLAEAAPEPPASLLAGAVNFLDELTSMRAAYAADLRKSYRTNQRGEFDIELTGASGPVQVTIRAGDNEQTFDLLDIAPPVPTGPSISIKESSDGPDFTSFSTASLKAAVIGSDGKALPGATVTWSIFDADNSANKAVVSGYTSRKTGLAWGTAATTSPGTDLTATETSTTDSFGNASINLTDIMGERKVYVQAMVTIDGTEYSLTPAKEISFGAGPLSKFSIPAGGIQNAKWADNYPLSSAGSLPAAALCGKTPTGFTSWGAGNYTNDTGLPSREELQAVSGSTGQGAALAAGWLGNNYWTGEADSAYNAYYVYLGDGYGAYGGVNSIRPVVCRR